VLNSLIASTLSQIPTLALTGILDWSKECNVETVNTLDHYNQSARNETRDPNDRNYRDS
jgi:hypothetical protein